MPDPMTAGVRYEERLRAEVYEHFRYLLDDYGYSLADPSSELGGLTVRYLNKAANIGVSVSIEWRDLHVEVDIGTLDAGAFRTGSSMLNQVFSVDSLNAVLANDDKASAPSTRPTEKDPKGRIAWLAQSLRKNGDDTLRGSTAVFSTLSSAAERAQEQQRRQAELDRDQRRQSQLIAAGAVQFERMELLGLEVAATRAAVLSPYPWVTWASLYLSWKQTALLTELGYPFVANSFPDRGHARDALAYVLEQLAPPTRAKLLSGLWQFDDQYFRWTFAATHPVVERFATVSKFVRGPWWGRMPRRVTANVARSYRDLGLDVEVVPDHNVTYLLD